MLPRDSFLPTGGRFHPLQNWRSCITDFSGPRGLKSKATFSRDQVSPSPAWTLVGGPHVDSRVRAMWPRAVRGWLPHWGQLLLGHNMLCSCPGPSPSKGTRCFTPHAAAGGGQGSLVGGQGSLARSQDPAISLLRERQEVKAVSAPDTRGRVQATQKQGRGSQGRGRIKSGTPDRYH